MEDLLFPIAMFAIPCLLGLILAAAERILWWSAAVFTGLMPLWIAGTLIAAFAATAVL